MIREVAGRLGTAVTVVTSLPALMRGQVANALIESDAVILAEHRRIRSDAKGAGDLFAAVFLGRLMQGHGTRTALQMASATLVDVMRMTARSGKGDVELVSAQQAIVEPRAQITLRSLAGEHDPAPRPV